MNKFKKIFIAVIMFFMMDVSGYAADKWDKTDITLGITAGVLTAMDLLQTRYIAIHPEYYYERNLILGKHPTTTNVEIYFGTVTVLGAAIAYYLPTKYRKWWLAGWIVVEMTMVAHNSSMGIGFAF